MVSAEFNDAHAAEMKSQSSVVSEAVFKFETFFAAFISIKVRDYYNFCVIYDWVHCGFMLQFEMLLPIYYYTAPIKGLLGEGWQ